MRNVRRLDGVPCPHGLKVVPDHPAYGLTPDGRVWSRKGNGRGPLRSDWREIRPVKFRTGYLYFTVAEKDSRSQISIHRLVAELWIGPIPHGHVVILLNCDPADNRVENLEITTVLGNFLHSVKAGRRDHLAGQRASRFDQGALRREVIQ